MLTEETLRRFAQLAALAIVVAGCFLVLRPFIAAILLALVVCISTWPLYERLRALLRGRSTLAALVMVLLLLLLVIAPSALLASRLTDNVAGMVETARAWLDRGPIQAPSWLKDIPIVGAPLVDYWQALAGGREETATLFHQLLEPARDFLLFAGKAIGRSLLQMTFAVFIGFFIFRDGDAWARTLQIGLKRLAGPVGAEMLTTIRTTVAGVVNGIFGTALAQALVAWIGFQIAGVPGAFLLGVVTFFLSLVPVGPPLVWGGATIWLFQQGAIGWAIFLALWGLLVVSSIDNFIKPYLISRGSHLPLLPIVLGVFGGVAAFGFIGIFIGPPLLALGLTLVRLWTTAPARAPETGEPPSA